MNTDPHRHHARPASAARQRPIATVERELCSAAAQIATITARLLTLLHEFDTRGGWAGAGITSCAHWLSWKCGMSLRTARDHVRVARRLAELPRTAAGLADGTLSYSKARAITRVATPHTEQDLVDAARHSTAAALERLVRGLRTAGREGDAPAPPPARVSHRWDPDTGDLLLSGRLRGADGTRLLAALSRGEFERLRTADATPDLTGPPPADCAGALIALADTMLAAGEAPAAATAAHVTFLADHSGIRVEDGPALPHAEAAAVLCSCHGHRVDTADGRILRYGRTRRLPSATQLRALHLRDGACRHPACGRTRFLHAHHVRPWHAGGTTDLDNLILLCGSCHRALHEGEFAIRAHGEQRFAFHAPDGTELPSAPHTPGDDDYFALPRPRYDALTPDWDGAPLKLHYAVSVLIDAWERDAQNRAA